MKDIDRVHYKADRKISGLWEEERSALLPLPNVAFEAMRLDSAVLNNYAQLRFEKATYAVPQGKPRQKVLLSVYWNRFEVRNLEGEILTILPQHYMLKEQPIDWAALFEVFSQRPRAVVHSAMFRHLPRAVRAYLQDVDAPDQAIGVRALRDVLKAYSMDQVAEALEALPADRRANLANLGLKLYALRPENRTPEPIAEDYTPLVVAAYDPDSALYDQLLPTRMEGVTMR